MKNIYTLMVAALALGACSQEEIQLQNGTNDQKSNCAAETLIVKAPSSRMAVVNGYQLNWTLGDSIQAFDAIGSYNIYELSQEVELGMDAEFKKVAGLPDTKPAKVIFPFNEKNVVADDGTIIVNVPSTYNSQQRAASLPVIGDIIDGTVDFGFLASFMGMLNMDLSAIPDGYDKIKIYANLPISHSFNVKGNSFDGYTSTPVLEDGDSNKASSEQRTIRINNITNKAEIYVALPAATYGDITITASNGTNEIQVLTFQNAKIESNTIYKVTYDTPMTSIPAIPAEMKDINSPTDMQTLGEYTWMRVNKPEEKDVEVSVADGMIKLHYAEVHNSPYKMSANCLVKAPSQPSKAYRVSFQWKGNGNAHLAMFATPTGGGYYAFAKWMSQIPNATMPTLNEWWDNSLATTTNKEDYEKWHTVNAYIVPAKYNNNDRKTSAVALESTPIEKLGDFCLTFYVNGKGDYYIKNVQISPLR